MQAIYEFLFDYGGYTPHGFCVAWNPGMLAVHILSDGLIAASYFAIPALILIFLRRRTGPSLRSQAVPLVLFIAACGLSHLVSIATIYVPIYGFHGFIKLTTGVISFVTVVALVRILPDALKIPPPGDLDGALPARDAADETDDRMQGDLRRKVRELETTKAELREFAYAASHDLKSPAHSLSFWFREFNEDHQDELSDAARETLSEAGQLMDRMGELMEDVLIFSQVVNRGNAKVELVGLNAAFDTAASHLAAEIGHAEARINIGPLPSATGDRSLLTSLAQNLLSNAIKFARQGITPMFRLTP